jgi:hypothetical protein
MLRMVLSTLFSSMRLDISPNFETSVYFCDRPRTAVGKYLALVFVPRYNHVVFVGQ